MQQALTPHLAPKLAPLPLALVVLAHVGVLATMAAARQPSDPLVPTPALMVEVINTEPHSKPQPRVQPLVKPAALPQPAPAKAVVPRPRPAQPAPVLVSASPSPAEAVMVPKESAKELKDPKDSKPAEPAPTASSNQAPVSTAAAATTTSSPSATQAITAPRFDANYLSNPKPAYPPLSRKLNEQGTVRLKVLVEDSGQPGKVDVAQSSGFERLDKAAVAAVSKWRFTPAKQGSVAVAAWVNVPIVFSLME
jgi:protein TonB